MQRPILKDVQFKFCRIPSRWQTSRSPSFSQFLDHELTSWPCKLLTLSKKNLGTQLASWKNGHSLWIRTIYCYINDQSVPASYMLSWVFLFVFLIIFTGLMNGFKIAQQPSHKREQAFQTRELMLKRWGSSPPNQLKKYLSPWSAKGHSREYQSNEKQRGYEIEVATPCKKIQREIRHAGLVSSRDFGMRTAEWSSTWRSGQ